MFQVLQIVLAIIFGGIGGESLSALAAATVIAQADEAPEIASLCPSPALSRVQSHQVVAGETLESIAAAYNLLPVTLLGMNPSIQVGNIAPGITLRIPPFNGIEISTVRGQTWQDLSNTYQLRADILFEVNGCPATLPDRIFIPGISWFPSVETTSSASDEGTSNLLTAYPLSETGAIVANFGWQHHPDKEELVFSSGITLEASPDASVLAVGDGTVAYVGEEKDLGTLIVINHAQGLQTRYAHVYDAQITTGDRVSAGQKIATAISHSDSTANLYFEVRTNSALGWVARNPGNYISALEVR